MGAWANNATAIRQKAKISELFFILFLFKKRRKDTLFLFGRHVGRSRKGRTEDTKKAAFLPLLCPLRDSNRFSNHITINLILNICKYHALFMGNVDIISGISTLLTIGFIPPPFPVHFAFYPLHFVLLFLFWLLLPVHFAFSPICFVLSFLFRPLLPVHFAFSPICFVLAFLFRPLLPVHFTFPFFGFVLASIFRPLPPVHSAFPRYLK